MLCFFSFAGSKGKHRILTLSSQKRHIEPI